MPRDRGKRREPGGGMKFFLALLGFAGLGLGVWLFRRKRKRR